MFTHSTTTTQLKSRNQGAASGQWQEVCCVVVFRYINNNDNNMFLVHPLTINKDILNRPEISHSQNLKGCWNENCENCENCDDTCVVENVNLGLERQEQ